MSHLWEWTLSYWTPRSLSESTPSQALQCRVSTHRILGYSQGKQIQAGSVSSTITAVGQAITLATNTNPTKIVRLDKLLPRLQQMLDGFRKADPLTTKQLPVEADVPEYLVQLGLSSKTRELDHAIGDLTMIAFYYLLCIGEYTTKRTCNNSKQMEEFKMGDITFFAKEKGTFAASLRMPCRTPLQQWMAPP